MLFAHLSPKQTRMFVYENFRSHKRVLVSCSDEGTHTQTQDCHLQCALVVSKQGDVLSTSPGWGGLHCWVYSLVIITV